MLRIRELAELTRGLDPAAFARQLGPFALVQRPPSEVRVKLGRAARSSATMPLPNLAKRALPPIEFEQLQVATLPPPQADGQMRLVIGRSPECDLVVDDLSASNQHARIDWNGTAGVLIDLSRTNGSFVNDQLASGSVVLANGDRLAFGQSHFVYYLSTALHERLKRAINP